MVFIDSLLCGVATRPSDGNPMGWYDGGKPRFSLRGPCDLGQVIYLFQSPLFFC